MIDIALPAVGMPRCEWVESESLPEGYDSGRCWHSDDGMFRLIQYQEQNYQTLLLQWGKWEQFQWAQHRRWIMGEWITINGAMPEGWILEWEVLAAGADTYTYQIRDDGDERWTLIGWKTNAGGPYGSNLTEFISGNVLEASAALADRLRPLPPPPQAKIP